MSVVPFSTSFEQLQPLASGLWGSVYRVRDKSIVIKVPKKEGLNMFFDETKCLERLGSSELIARYLGIGKVETAKEAISGLLYEYYPFGTLKDFMNQPLSSGVRDNRQQQLLWAHQIVEAIVHVHTHNVVHGDIGIHNMLVANNYDLKLTDFGGSSLDGAEMQVECSPRYHRPHSWRFPIVGIDDLSETWKIPTRVADTFALGTVLYEIFTSTQLYKNETYDQIRQHATKREYPDLSRVDLAEVKSVIEKCWNEQYEDVRQLQQDLQPIWGGMECQILDSSKKT